MSKIDVESCIKYLDKWEYLEFGKIIPVSVFETLFQIHYEDSWEYLGPLLAVKDALAELGYLSTRRGVEVGCLKIYDVEECLISAERLFSANLRKMAKLNSCLNTMKSEDFEEKEMRKHMHVTNKISSGLHAMKSILITY